MISAAVFAFGLSAVGVVDGCLVVAHAGGGYTPQSVIGLAVSSSVEPVPFSPARRRLGRDLFRTGQRRTLLSACAGGCHRR